MSAHAANEKPISANQEYTERLDALKRLQSQAQRREHRLGIAKLAIAGAALATAVFLMHHFASIGAIAALIVAFLVLAVRHEKLLNELRARGRVMDYYERGLARLEDGWKGSGETGERFLDSAHPYARDLDLFGDASLFQYLSVARTRVGEETLARWLLEPAPADEILTRQSAVRELAAKVNFRERLSTAGEAVRGGVHPEALARWGERTAILSSASVRVATTALALLWLLSIAAWGVWGSPAWLVTITVLNFAYAHRLHERLERAAGAIEKASGDLLLIAHALELLERESFAAEKLTTLQAAIAMQGVAPSRAMRKLARLAEMIESRHSLFARPLDLVTFWSAQLVFVAESWQRKFGPAIGVWIAAVGEVEALASLATLAYEHPNYAFPEFAAERPEFEAEEVAHPLLPARVAIGNDVALGKDGQAMILSGPNMAGKSTFIRSIGVNAVLAQCGAPVRARRMRISLLHVAASICVLDSLSGGVSRFYAEIRRIKLIVDLAWDDAPVLFLLDELLSGTNSHDRLIGTQFVLKILTERNAIGVVSTHDLALTHIAEEMSGRVFNAHFEDRIEQGRLVFDYKLKSGVVRTSNALELMRAIGLGVEEPSRGA